MIMNKVSHENLIVQGPQPLHDLRAEDDLPEIHDVRTRQVKNNAGFLTE